MEIIAVFSPRFRIACTFGKELSSLVCHSNRLLNFPAFMCSLCQFFPARFAFKLYITLKKEAASLKIQTKLRGHLARKSYMKLKLAVIALQTGIRVAVARAKFRYVKQTRGALIIQVSLLGIMY